ncbi:unnamed protein product, partial [Ectocarpus sp. 4 AP-2014]
ERCVAHRLHGVPRQMHDSVVSVQHQRRRQPMTVCSSCKFPEHNVCSMKQPRVNNGLQGAMLCISCRKQTVPKRSNK